MPSFATLATGPMDLSEFAARPGPDQQSSTLSGPVTTTTKLGVTQSATPLCDVIEPVEIRQPIVIPGLNSSARSPDFSTPRPAESSVAVHHVAGPPSPRSIDSFDQSADEFVSAEQHDLEIDPVLDPLQNASPSSLLDWERSVRLIHLRAPCS
jgi:hypothetical protein